MKPPGYDLRECSMAEVDRLCSMYHGYGGASKRSVYCYGVYEEGGLVAAYSWQPPPLWASKAVCPEFPQGVLSLSRMVAVPRDQRLLNHVSKPLRRQMKSLIDRGRWPVLITYSDEGEGHTGHVYKCSGWIPTVRSIRPTYLNNQGVRASCYSNGKARSEGLTRGPDTIIQRWEHRVCPDGEAWEYAQAQGIQKVPTGKVWRSGNPAYTYRREDGLNPEVD